MGGATSTTSSKIKPYQLQKSEEDVIQLMMPVYYMKSVTDEKDRKIAMDSWELILNDLSPVYLQRKGQPDFHFTACVTFFYDAFYKRLFDIHPTCRHMFKSGMRSQGKFLVRMITLSLTELDDPEKFDQTLIRLAEIHYARGVKTAEYGIVGEVLFYTLRMCLGKSIYLPSVHRVWVKVYSRMLRTIVPVAVALELKNIRNPAQASAERSARCSSYMFSQDQTQSFSHCLSTEDGDDEAVDS